MINEHSAMALGKAYSIDRTMRRNHAGWEHALTATFGLWHARDLLSEFFLWLVLKLAALRILERA